MGNPAETSHDAGNNGNADVTDLNTALPEPVHTEPQLTEQNGSVVDGNNDNTQSEDASNLSDPDRLSQTAEELFMFDGAPLPDFIPPEETERERALREELETLRAQQGSGQQNPREHSTEPQKPKRDDFYGDDEYENALRQYFTDHDEWKGQVQRSEEVKKHQQVQFREAVGVYVDKRQAAATKLQNFDRYEKHADDNLNPGIVGAILFGGQNGTFSNAPEMMYVIGRNPELLKKLNEVNDPFLAGAMLLDISKKASWAPAAPKPEPNPVPEIQGGNLQTLAVELEQAEAEAERTGDRTRVIELQGKIRDARKK